MQKFMNTDYKIIDFLLLLGLVMADSMIKYKNMSLQARSPNETSQKKQWWFFKKFQGEGVELARYFERSTFSRQLLENICRLHVLFIRQNAQEN